MRARAVLIVAVLLMLASAHHAAAAGRVVLTGGEFVEVTPPCSHGSPPCVIHHLSAITYAAAGTTANGVTFAYEPRVNQDVCTPDGPGCDSVRIIESFLINESNAIVERHGLCQQMVSARLSSCGSTTDSDVAAYALSPLPASFDLGSGNDTFTAQMDPAQGWPVAFDVRAGNGNDTVVLIDPVPGAADTISCGSGVDRVVTSVSTTVTSDCENVTRL
jgi:hypothetical protein